jgi:hypothetical protein
MAMRKHYAILEALIDVVVVLVVAAATGGWIWLLPLLLLLGPARRIIQWSRTMSLYQRNIRDELKMLRMELELVRLARHDETSPQDD